MFLNKIRHEIVGYKTPRPFSIKRYAKCTDYDFNVVNDWISKMHNLTNSSFSIIGKNILELGPGDDLGTGLILLAMGANKYNALDINPLAENTPMEFYDFLLLKIIERFPKADEYALKHELQFLSKGNDGRLNYIVDKKFSFSKLASKSIDIVFSHAAFDCFDNIERTFQEISRVIKPGGFILAYFELQTHTRWIRNKDPLSIYRYSDSCYNFLRFKGSPNRLRPDYYINVLNKLNWKDIVFIPERIIDESQLATIVPYLHERFKKYHDINFLSGTLFARKCL